MKTELNLNAEVRRVPLPDDGLPMTNGPLAVGEEHPGVFIRGADAALLGGMLTGACERVMAGAPDSADLSLCAVALRVANLLSVSDLSGRSVELISQVVAKLESFVLLEAVPGAGAKQ